MSDTTVIAVDGVTMGWDGRVVLDNVSLKVSRGDFMAITGPNGGGKTTLMRIILGLLRPLKGAVSYFDGGMRVDRLSIGYLPQKSMVDTRFPVSVREVIESGLLASRQMNADERCRRVDDMLSLVDLEAHASKTIGDVSGGQMQRALLGRALVSCPDVVVLDEPLSYVDKHFESRIYDIVGDLKSKATVLLVSHEMSTIADIANRHLIVDVRLRECSACHHSVHFDCDC